MYDELSRQFRDKAKRNWIEGKPGLARDYTHAADAIEELSKRIDRAVELYNRGVERSAMYEALVGIAPEPPKEEAPAGPYDLLYEEGGPDA